MFEANMQPVTVALPTLGCKANRYDSDALARALIACGYVIVPANARADIYIVNTCTVTREAEAKSRKMLRRTLKINDEALLVITGCYASLEPEQLGAIEGVDLVVPISEQARIPELLQQRRPPQPGGSCSNTLPFGLTASVERTRATVKVQDGCNLRCAFCAVTLARGPVRSRPLSEVIAELRALVAAGIKEIVLTGIRLDAYGLDLHGPRLAELLDATQELGITRLRLSSLEPIGITPHLIERMAAHPSLCHHFHVCLQSGDDGVLQAMRRGYTAQRFRRTIDLLRAAIPDASFTTDLIVGFPGENDAAFAATCTLVREIGFMKLHIFKFSPRPRTAAAIMADQVPEAMKEARSAELYALEQHLFSAYVARLIGTPVSVLVERTGADGDGLTAHYLRVHAPFAAKDAGNIVSVVLQECRDGYAVGTNRHYSCVHE